MSALTASYPHSFSPAPTPMECLGQMEQSLLESRSRILAVIDEELAAVHQWRQALLSTTPVFQPFAPLVPKPESMLTSYKMGKIVPLDMGMRNEAVSEAKDDPDLIRATVEELNAALEAAFNQIAQGQVISPSSGR